MFPQFEASSGLSGCRRAFWVAMRGSSSVLLRNSALAAGAFACSLLAACARNVAVPDPGLDPLATSAVPATTNPVLSSAGTTESDAELDAATIADAVTSVPFEGRPIAWANPATGSSGSVDAVTERRTEDGALCRDFTALRTSYDGIRNYRGTVCLTERGAWTLSRFDPV
jgi:surface antigen